MIAFALVAILSFGTLADRATNALVQTFYVPGGYWRACAAGCDATNQDWGDDALTATLWLRWRQTHDPQVATILTQLGRTIPTYKPCLVSACTQWSDVPEWDAVAAMHLYDATHDPGVLAKAKAAYSSVEDSKVYGGGACVGVRYQRPNKGSGGLKTLETEATAIRAALLLFGVTRNARYLSDAQARYTAARRIFLDRATELYTVYAFDDGKTCTRLPRRFFASVNGEMILNGLALGHDTGNPRFTADARRTAAAVRAQLSDASGTFVDLQAENDIVEPLVEAMLALARGGDAAAGHWIVSNAAAAATHARSSDIYGRFFNGTPPQATVTAWQENGGAAIEIAAATLAPAAWMDDQVVDTLVPQAVPLTVSMSIQFSGRGIVLYGALGDRCCEAGHARVLVDGVETPSRTGIWQNKSSSGKRIPGTVLFAWRWAVSGKHRIDLLPGLPNPKEGGPYLRLERYDIVL